ncbi:RecX family transcriptional regulator [Microbacterium sp. Se5.02b]|nr:RecX family transcriptional regulator [Microbacterium sp. Se5.02b]
MAFDVGLPVHRRAAIRCARWGSPSDRHPARGASRRPGSDSPHTTATEAPRLRALSGQNSAPADGGAESVDEARVAAEESLVRKLRARSLSVSEARQVLRGFELESGIVDDVIDDFCRRGYLDDEALAGVLVVSGVERKGQGRVALSRALAQRGIPRDVIDGALDELPDDDDERALDFARGKARSLSRLDHDTALRRLVGQLSRRGYNGSVAMKAAKAALREATFGGSTSGVRFVDSD